MISVPVLIALAVFVGVPFLACVVVLLFSVWRDLIVGPVINLLRQKLNGS